MNVDELINKLKITEEKNVKLEQELQVTNDIYTYISKN